MRCEQEIFDELAGLCTSAGYIHALAAICFRDTIVGFSDELKPKHLARLFSPTHLIRTELTTLMGLMLREPVDFSLPSQQAISDYIERSDALLEELHQSITAAGFGSFGPEKLADPEFNPFTVGEVLREAIFYSAESAYTFQYRDFALLKYAADTKWLTDNRGLNLSTAREIIRSLTDLLNDRLLARLKELRSKPVAEWTMLPGFTFSCAELAARTGVTLAEVTKLVEAFCASGPQVNVRFTSLHAFNAAYAFPFIRKGEDEFILLQYYGITEALYETPFYWMGADETYAPTALKHRGEFTENFAFERLVRVFGADRVFRNVEILKSKGEALGEIDVLVIFGDRAIVLQAKSKKLTLEARKGNDLRLQDDFKAAVQDAVDQAFSCAARLGDSAVTLRCRDGRALELSKRPRTVYPLIVVSDHYPALAFQARQFLKFTATEQIVAPLVIDVFALDAITEMLSSPLRFLSYLRLRARFGETFMMSHEHTLLSYHLKRNLWGEKGVDLMMVGDDVSSDLDIAMAARRDGVPGARTPEGILTKFADTPFDRLVCQIEREADPVAISLGFLLVEMSEETVHQLNRLVSRVIQLTKKDGALHDLTIGLSEASAGVTVHCSNLATAEAEKWLYSHCRVRKYSQKSDTWYGVALHPDGSLHLAAELTGPWQLDAEMELRLSQAPKARNLLTRRKPGRNAPCPCGSGKKYKKCCLERETEVPH